MLRIRLVHVGLTGNVQGGFRVVLGVLQATNANVQQILGQELTLVGRVKDKRPQDDSITFTSNTILGAAKVMIGNVGMDGEAKAPKREIKVTGNTFHGDLHLVSGDMGGKAAENFNQFFWSSK
ncbi:hypothetical protein AJ80_01440 [Polytolypa hystricis UAMH7299]|uniref:Uncharacterized protein n=1 Tax=Polytolypa hystricis (strain UAMH7299) TaxID=1447883 RepID=A0A2B7Z0U6_POLH7|nr:hypothetical protein AJ80_01440 [Polytolypa hystricis UAMH7299]